MATAATENICPAESEEAERCRSLRDERLSGKTRDRAAIDQDPRTEAARDRDRIIYAASFRRLSGVTQVITPPGYAPTLHTRLTHSLKVAQIARSIGVILTRDPKDEQLIQRLGGLDPTVCEAAALAHDIGHPPFGHIGEEVLDREARRMGLRDGFEGNAQSLRIITTGLQRSTASQGLDLTCATLAAIAKYPWVRGSEPCGTHPRTNVRQCKAEGLPCGHDRPCERVRTWRKFNFYDEQQELISKVRQFSGVDDGIQTLEASVMDLADDIAYAIHDLEDFFLSGLINTTRVVNDLRATAPEGNTGFNELARSLEIKYSQYFHKEAFYCAVAALAQECEKFFAVEAAAAQPSHVSGLIGSLTAKWIGDFLSPSALVLSPDPLWDHGPHVSLQVEKWHSIQILKFITKNYIIKQSDIALLQRGQQTIMLELVGMLERWSEDDFDRLPARLQEQMVIADNIHSGDIRKGYGEQMEAPRGERARAIIDYICTLTDSQTMALHERLSGRKIHSGGVSEVF